jgi:hypothetical protein
MRRRVFSEFINTVFACNKNHVKRLIKLSTRRAQDAKLKTFPKSYEHSCENLSG